MTDHCTANEVQRMQDWPFIYQPLTKVFDETLSELG